MIDELITFSKQNMERKGTCVGLDNNKLDVLKAGFTITLWCVKIKERRIQRCKNGERI